METGSITSYTNPYKEDRIYGNDIKEYAIDGEKGKCFADVVAFASLRQAHAVESLSMAVSDVIRERQKKVEALGEVLATLAEAIGNMDSSESDPDDRWSPSMPKLDEANDLLEKYGYEKMTLSNSKINYTNGYRAQNDVQKYLDTENNDINQNMIFLQGLVAKRDNSFTVANRVVSRVNKTANNTIRAIGS